MQPLNPTALLANGEQCTQTSRRTSRSTRKSPFDFETEAQVALAQRSFSGYDASDQRDTDRMGGTRSTSMPIALSRVLVGTPARRRSGFDVSNQSVIL